MLPTLHAGAVTDALNVNNVPPVFELRAVTDALNVNNVPPVFELSTSLTSLPVHLEDRFVIIDAEALREGNCIASVQQDASGLDVVAVCFQVFTVTFSGWF
jgi:hypothetical protein